MVGDGADAVDYELIRVCHKGDIVVSQDYGVTAIALGRGSYAINHSGIWYSNKNINQMIIERYLNNEVKKYPHHRVRRTKKRKKGGYLGI